MSKRFVLTLLCSALFIPFTLQTASATPSCDAASLRRVFLELLELKRQASKVEELTARLVFLIDKRGAAATEELQEEYDRVKSAGAYHQRLCHEGQRRSCITADRFEDYAEGLVEAIYHLGSDITAAMNAVLTRSNNITEEIDSELNWLIEFIRECLSSGR